MKLSYHTRVLYLNTLKSVLKKDNWNFLKKNANDETIRFLLVAFHKLDRDRKKFNEYFEKTFVIKEEPINLIEEAIELHKNSIKTLEKLKRIIFLSDWM